MTEQISALMDGDLSEDESLLQIDLLGKNEKSRETWGTYTMIGDALRGRLNPGCARSVSARLANEPTILAPKSRKPELQGKKWFVVSAAAIAAGAAFVGWISLPILTGLQPAPLDGSRSASGTEVAVRTVPATSSANIGDYLMAHQQFSPSNTMQGVAPYVRLVSEDREGEGR